MEDREKGPGRRKHHAQVRAEFGRPRACLSTEHWTQTPSHIQSKSGPKAVKALVWRGSRAGSLSGGQLPARNSCAPWQAAPGSGAHPSVVRATQAPAGSPAYTGPPSAQEYSAAEGCISLGFQWWAAADLVGT